MKGHPTPFRVVVVALATALLSSLITPTAASATPPPSAESYSVFQGAVRLSGRDRYETAVAVAQHAAGPSQGVLYLASGADFADALSATALDGPLLLLPPGDEVPRPVREEARRLAPQSVVVIGGPNAVSDRAVRQVAGDAPVRRIAGRNRYETSALAARERGHADTVFVASGDGFAEALLAAPTGYPVLLVSSGGAVSHGTVDALRALDPAHVIALGGPQKVPEETLQTIADGRPSHRVSGADPLSTAVALSRLMHADGAVDAVTLSRMDTFADGLGARMLPGGPLLLVPPCGELPVVVSRELERLGPDLIRVLGGEEAICPKLVDAAARAAGLPNGPSRPRGAKEDPFRLGGTAWPKDRMPIRYAVRSDRADWIQTVVRAFDTWAAQADLTMTRVSPGQAADVVVEWTNSCSQCGQPNGVLAWATVGVNASNWIHFDAAEHWTTDGRAGIDLYTVALHEAGHVLGLSHSTVWQAVMYEKYKGPQRLHDDDIRGIVARYGAKTRPPAPGPLSVSFTENPFRCDGGSRSFGRVSGAQSGERITFTSPQLGELLPGTADGSGALTIRWQCDPSEAGRRWDVTARGERSGRSVSFVVTGADAPAPPPPAAPAPPGEPRPPAEPAPLSVSFTENPFRCDGGSRSFGRVSGAQSGERITFTSPQLGELLPGTADDSGALTIRWQCDPSEAGRRWDVTARGERSGRSVSFVVTGADAPAPPPTAPAPPPPVPPPAPASVTVSKGGSAQGRPGCSSSGCRYVDVTLARFAADAAVRVECWSSLDAGPYYTYTMRTGSSGSGFSAVCYYGYGGQRVWVVAGGVRSNDVVW